jgi:hypothetical protein
MAARIVDAIDGGHPVLFYCVRFPFSELPMTTFKNIVLYTDTDGFARFREEDIALPGGSPKALLSELFPSNGFQVRHSPPGVSSDFHCTTTAQWLVVLSGEMEIGLRDGTTRRFKAGDHFFSNDVLPEGATFDSAVHGHCSRVVGDASLTTLFVRT